MASKFPRALIARMQRVRGLVPGAYITKIPRQLIPPHVQAPALAPAFFSTKPHPDPTAPLPAAAMQNTEARSRPRDEPEFTRRLVASPLGDAHTIKDALDLYKLNDWGFVLFPCTYRSQEKWDKFAALARGHARDCFEKAGLMDAYACMRWTVFEDRPRSTALTWSRRAAGSSTGWNGGRAAGSSVCSRHTLLTRRGTVASCTSTRRAWRA
ncbi:hypothetical protein N657DRAFT_367444 [Parathielavia appendiculata]|uniref:Uncharacterized protein n=1 Tax=Parathielavia appendiculata TaxID=2587402 RepID=A0AAN6YYC6_9PEZI|nr:hypothetical protein N657DRAFT_367444 [Parathielavia appendiculata]